MAKDYKMYINGEWVSALDGQLYDDFNPYTGELFARVPLRFARTSESERGWRITAYECFNRANDHRPL